MGLWHESPSQVTDRLHHLHVPFIHNAEYCSIKITVMILAFLPFELSFGFLNYSLLSITMLK